LWRAKKKPQRYFLKGPKKVKRAALKQGKSLVEESIAGPGFRTRARKRRRPEVKIGFKWGKYSEKPVPNTS